MSEKVQTTVRIEKNLYKELKAISLHTGLSITSLLIVAIWKNVLGLKY